MPRLHGVRLARAAKRTSRGADALARPEIVRPRPKTPMSQDSQRGSGPPGAPPEEGARDRQALLDSLPYWTWTPRHRVHPDDRDEVASV
jgi:hypothetical protein